MKRKLLWPVFTLLLLLCPALYAGPLPLVYLNRVVAIGRKDTTPGPTFGKWIGEATGFFYGEFDHKVNETQNAYTFFLVTNRHVLEEHRAATNGPLSVRLNRKSGGPAQEVDFLLVVDGLPTWHSHPDPLVDVVVIALNSSMFQAMGIDFDYFKSDADTLSRVKAKELGLAEGYGVFVLGFPMGLVGTEQDYVIVREGSIARIRDNLDSPTTARNFLIDSFIFPWAIPLRGRRIPIRDVWENRWTPGPTSWMSWCENA